MIILFLLKNEKDINNTNKENVLSISFHSKRTRKQNPLHNIITYYYKMLCRNL